MFIAALTFQLLFATLVTAVEEDTPQKSNRNYPAVMVSCFQGEDSISQGTTNQHTKLSRRVGPEGSAYEIEWSYLRSSGTNDIFRFIMKRFVDTGRETRETNDVVFSGLTQSLFVSTNQLVTLATIPPTSPPRFDSKSKEGRKVTFKQVGMWPDTIRGSVRDVKVIGNHVYASVWPDWFITYEITANDLVQKGACHVPVDFFQIQNEHAYIGGNTSNLTVIDITTPDSPKVVGTCPESEGIMEFAIHGPILYAATTNGVRMIDISTPEKPHCTGTFLEGNKICKIKVFDEHLFVLGEDIQIWDVSAPSTTKLIARYKHEKRGLDFFVTNNLAYILRDRNCLEIVDLHSITNPTTLATFSSKDLSNSDTITIHDNTAFLMNGRLCSIDVSNPEQPGPSFLFTNYFSRRTSLSESTLVLTDGGTLNVFKILNSTNIVPIARKIMASFPQDVEIRNNIAYIAEQYGLRILDVSHLDQPRELGWAECSFNGSMVRIRENRAYLVDQWCISWDGPFSHHGPVGLLVYDIANPAHPRLLTERGTGDTHTKAYHIFDNLAYWFDAGWKFIDLTDPKHPVILKDKTPFPNLTGEFAIKDNYAFTGQMPGRFKVYDISSQAKPSIIGQCAFFDTSQITGIEFPTYLTTISGHHVFLYPRQSVQCTLCVFDIENPQLPHPVAYVDIPVKDWINYILAVDHFLYVVQEKSVSVYDVTNPQQPLFAGEIEFGERVMNIRVSGNHLYVCVGNKLVIYELQ
jgi:hypothetical protein